MPRTYDDIDDDVLTTRRRAAVIGTIAVLLTAAAWLAHEAWSPESVRVLGAMLLPHGLLALFPVRWLDRAGAAGALFTATLVLSMLLVLLPAAVVFDGMMGMAILFLPWLIALFAVAVLFWIALTWAHFSSRCD